MAKKEEKKPIYKSTLSEIIKRIFDQITVRGTSFGAIIAAIFYGILSYLGWDEGSKVVMFGAVGDSAPMLDAETAKQMIALLGGVLGVMLDRFPEMAGYFRDLISAAGIEGSGSADERFDHVDKELKAIRKVTDNLETT